MALNLEQASNVNAIIATAQAGMALSGLTGAATTYVTAAAVTVVNSVITTKAAVGAGVTATAVTDGGGAPITLTASKSRVLVWCINSAGTVGVVAGPMVDWPNSSGTASGSPIALQWPPVPANFIPFAYHVLSGGSNLASTFTVGTSNWNTTGITVGTVVNVCGALPNTLAVTP